MSTRCRHGNGGRQRANWNIGRESSLLATHPVLVGFERVEGENGGLALFTSGTLSNPSVRAQSGWNSYSTDEDGFLLL
jgi:hypothetical protein